MTEEQKQRLAKDICLYIFGGSYEEVARAAVIALTSKDVESEQSVYIKGGQA